MLTVAAAVGHTAFRAARVAFRRGGSLRDARLSLVHGLVFALDLFLAADLVKTVLAPGLEEIGILAAIVLLRTLLVFALERELASGREAGR